MKVAIHYNERSFADGWISYCKKHDILYKIVNAYDTNIISQLEDCDFFFCYHHHANYKDALFAKQLLYSLEIAGKKVFPNYHTCWHFDDKVGQKYLLESIGAPLVPSYVFYTKKEALDWINGTSFPKVFKLRGGAGSANVLLVHNKSEAIKLARQSFGKGFSQFNGWSNFKERFEKWRLGKTSVLAICKGLARVLIPTEYAKMHSPEKGYIYFQEFIPNNTTDTRIVVVGDKIIGERRGCRENDFRASGSHILLPDATQVDINCVKLAYRISKLLHLQVGVFDFVHNEEGNPLIVEISYGTDPDYTECEGYWDENFVFHETEINLSEMIIESFLKSNLM